MSHSTCKAVVGVRMPRECLYSSTTVKASLGLFCVCCATLRSWAENTCPASPGHSLNVVASSKTGVLFFYLELYSPSGFLYFCSHIPSSLGVIGGGDCLTCDLVQSSPPVLECLTCKSTLLLTRLRIGTAFNLCSDNASIRDKSNVGQCNILLYVIFMANEY